MFNENLKKYRLDKNLSQEQLAEKLYVRRQTVSKWEKGANEPDFDTLKKISQILEVSIETLLDSGASYEHKLDRKNARLNAICDKLFFSDLLLFIFCCAAVFIILGALPQIIPAHWNATGVIDRYGSKFEVLLHLVSFAVFFIVDAIIYFTVKNNRKVRNERMASAIASGAAITMQLAYLIFIVVLYCSYFVKSTVSVCTNFAIGAILACSVAMFPKFTPQNVVVGVRTNFTLSNKTAWYKVNLFASLFWGITSLALLAVNVAVDFKYDFVLIAVYLVPLAATLIFHEILRKKQKRNAK